jgi:ribosomal protein S18 acetylase RimI-like enzyme
MELNLTMILREANLTDLSNIAALHAQSWRENYSDVLSAEYLNENVISDRKKVWTERLATPSVNQYVLIAEERADFCGFVCVFGAKHPKHGSIVDNLHVNSRIKGKGLGTKLLIAAAKWAVKHYKDYDLYLEVLENNESAIGFYESLGGKKIDFAFWRTPCGNEVKEFIYSWGSPESLANNDKL